MLNKTNNMATDSHCFSIESTVWAQVFILPFYGNMFSPYSRGFWNPEGSGIQGIKIGNASGDIYWPKISQSYFEKLL